MEIKKPGTMGLVKSDALDKFFGKDDKIQPSDENIWRVSLMFTKEEEETCRLGFEALPRKKRAMRDYQKEAILDQARKDIEKGNLLKKAMEDLDKQR